MARFLWEQRNPWNFDLYIPEEVTKNPDCLANKADISSKSINQKGPFIKGGFI